MGVRCTWLGRGSVGWYLLSLFRLLNLIRTKKKMSHELCNWTNYIICASISILTRRIAPGSQKVSAFYLLPLFSRPSEPAVNQDHHRWWTGCYCYTRPKGLGGMAVSRDGLLCREVKSKNGRALRGSRAHPHGRNIFRVACHSMYQKFTCTTLSWQQPKKL